MPSPSPRRLPATAVPRAHSATPARGSALDCRTLRFGDYRTRAILRPGRGPTVLCLHGWSDSADAYRPLFRTLSDTDINFIALDCPGHGEGPRLLARPARVLPQMTDFVVAAIDHFSHAQSGPSLRADRAAGHTANRHSNRHGPAQAQRPMQPLILLGHSLGGRTALAAAAERAECIAAVMALAPAPLRLRAWLRTVAAERWLIPRAAALLRLLPDTLARRQYLRGHRRTFYAPETVDADVFARFAQFCDARRMADYTSGLHRVGGELGDALDLRALHMPVDLVWGCDDRLVPPAAARAYQARLPQARLITLAQCGHNPAQEQTEVVARQLRALLVHARR